jgi:hypothetical protein
VISRKCNGLMSLNLGEVQKSIGTIGGTGFSKHSTKLFLQIDRPNRIRKPCLGEWSFQSVLSNFKLSNSQKINVTGGPSFCIRSSFLWITHRSCRLCELIIKTVHSMPLRK